MSSLATAAPTATGPRLRILDSLGHYLTPATARRLADRGLGRFEQREGKTILVRTDTMASTAQGYDRERRHMTRKELARLPLICPDKLLRTASPHLTDEQRRVMEDDIRARREAFRQRVRSKR